MCWKHEWARAVNNLNWANIHIERAKVKVEKRGTLEAAAKCQLLIEKLAAIQEELKDLIENYGISRKKKSTSMEGHMKGRRKKRGKIKQWVKKN